MSGNELRRNLVLVLELISSFSLLFLSVDADPSSSKNLDVPPLTIPSTEYSWEWGELPTKSPAPTTATFEFPTLTSDDTPPARPSSLPPTPLDPSELSDPTNPFSPPPSQPLRLSSYPPSIGRATDKSELQTIPVEGRLKNHEEDPYKFTFEVSTLGETEKRSHSFELSLCGNERLGVDSRKVSRTDFRRVETSRADRSLFLFLSTARRRRSFPRWPSHLPEVHRGARTGRRSIFGRSIQRAVGLCLSPSPPSSRADFACSFSSLRYLTWHNASPVVASLLLYRKSLLPPPVLAPLPDSLLDFEPTPVTSTDASSPTDQEVPVPEKIAAASGSGWSRWWRRSKTLDSDLPTRESEGEANGANELDEDKPKLPSVAEVDLGIDGDASAPEETRAPAYSRSASVSLGRFPRSLSRVSRLIRVQLFLSSGTSHAPGVASSLSSPHWRTLAHHSLRQDSATLVGSTRECPSRFSIKTRLADPLELLLSSTRSELSASRREPTPSRFPLPHPTLEWLPARRESSSGMRAIISLSRTSTEPSRSELFPFVARLALCSDTLRSFTDPTLLGTSSLLSVETGLTSESRSSTPTSRSSRLLSYLGRVDFLLTLSLFFVLLATTATRSCTSLPEPSVKQTRLETTSRGSVRGTISFPKVPSS